MEDNIPVDLRTSKNLRFPASYKLIIPQVGEKLFPVDDKDVVAEGIYGVLANRDEIFKYTFFF